MLRAPDVDREEQRHGMTDTMVCGRLAWEHSVPIVRRLLAEMKTSSQTDVHEILLHPFPLRRPAV